MKKDTVKNVYNRIVVRRELENSLEHKIFLSFDRFVIGLYSNSSILIEELSTYYGNFISVSRKPDIRITAIEGKPPSFPFDFKIKKPDPGKTKIKEEHADLPDGRIVRKRLTGMVFVFGSGRNLCIGPAVANANQVINFINNRYIEKLVNSGYLLAHASAVDLNRYGLAIAGFSGMGKSTLALHMLESNVKFISNDRLLIKEIEGVVNMSGVAKLPRINPGTVLNNRNLHGVIPDSERSEFAALPSDELWELEHKYDVPVDDLFGEGKFILSSGLRGIAILNWNRSEKEAHIKRVDLSKRRDLLRAFMKPVGLFYQPNGTGKARDFSEEAYLGTLKDCPVIEISGGVDFIKASKACYELLKDEGA